MKLSSFFTFDFSKGEIAKFTDKTINELVKACYEMGKVKTGALIVIEDEIVLSEYERTGIAVDGILTSQLLINIFEKNTPLHDGAVIVRGDRVVSATCYLPLTDSLTSLSLLLHNSIFETFFSRCCINESLFFKNSASTLRYNSPPMAMETFPVSSDTTMVSESLTSLIPTAARCLVPRSLLILKEQTFIYTASREESFKN